MQLLCNQLHTSGRSDPLVLMVDAISLFASTSTQCSEMELRLCLNSSASRLAPINKILVFVLHELFIFTHTCYCVLLLYSAFCLRRIECLMIK